MEDIPGMRDVAKNATIWEYVANDLSGRPNKDNKLNFSEWLFVRVVAVSWGIASGYHQVITRDELLDIALKIFP